MPDPLTSTNLLAAASEQLTAANYRQVDEPLDPAWRARNVRVFEDAYSIVAIVIYDTWQDLAGGWEATQSAFVELMAKHLSSSDAKAWEGYLVLLTAAIPPPDSRQTVARIRRDTSRVRKLLATGDDLKSVVDVEQTLLPLLPLNVAGQNEPPQSVLDLLPPLLERKGIRPDDSRVLISAFRDQQPLLEKLDDHWNSR